MKIKVIACFETNWHGADTEQELEVEVPDNSTQEEQEEIIDSEVKEWAAQHYSCSWSLPLPPQPTPNADPN